ncbi:hypothetical protein BASA81_003535 [Batrachochytrium salamandrivorans]|nr:hypothetical protein BASA81_003535 [Batrachochytrium salamandrivorans]
MQELAEKFLDSAYQGEGHVQLIEYAKACLDTFRGDSNKFFAASISFVQSLGYGKTRTLLEAASEEPLVYVCARPAYSFGYPSRSGRACAFLKLDPRAWLGSPIDAHIDLKVRLLVIYKVASGMSDICKDAKLQFKGSFSPLWDSVDSEYKQVVANWKGNASASSDRRNEPAALTRLIQECASGAFVMLAIDEASLLLDLDFPGGKTVFRAVRLAMRELQTDGIQMVLVLTDTHSNISTFLPPSFLDSSRRPSPNDAESVVRGLFPPFILRTTFDALRETYGMGRPLVAEYATNVSFLQSKLLCADTADKANADGLLAMVLVRVAVHISPQSRVSERVVASHMGTVLASSFDDKALLVTYLSEPPLAAAASKFWDANLHMLLPVLREALTNGAVSAGSAGEIVAQIVCLVAFDSQCSRNRLNTYIPLVSFLRALQQSQAQVKIEEFIPLQHNEAQVSVLQFIQLPKRLEFTESALKELYKRQTACVLPGQAGADLLIPYFVEATGEYSFVLVQVENWEVGSEYEEILEKLIPAYVFGDTHVMAQKLCVRVCMHLGVDRDQKPHPDPHAGLGYKALELYGVRFRCLKDDLVGHLDHLLTTTNDALEFVDVAVSQCKDKKIPVPTSDSREGLRGFPFVCDEVGLSTTTPARHRASCCTCRSGTCKGCVCYRNNRSCTSCQSAACTNAE